MTTALEKKKKIEDALRKAFAQMTPDVSEFGEWSAGEKYVMTKMCEKQPKLPHPLVDRINAKGGVEKVYDLEGDYEALEDAWPFVQWRPALDDMVWDIHSRRLFRFRNSMIIRLNGRNMLVCEDYFKTGGMAVDILQKEPEPSNDGVQCFATAVKDAKSNGQRIELVIGGGNASGSDGKPSAE